ncbi:MAG: UDP-N-acetylmuramoyl-tripeptide--D-alanyl-D-alanine ligase [Burkholderiales bacterium]
MMRLVEAARMAGATLRGADAVVLGVSTDSRGIAAGELFVAIRGETYDGHDFVRMAAGRGAAGALVDAAWAARQSAPDPLPLLLAEDARVALGRLGAGWRQKFAPAVIAVAGSNGKTTTKEMLASILRAHAGEPAVLATAGNLNGDIGVPLTLLRMGAAHRYAVIELGMNHPGEMAPIAAMTRPGCALITNAHREHLEFMGSVEGAAGENALVFDALPVDGIAVINADDALAQFFRERAKGRRVVDFGIEAGATVGARYVLRHLSSEIRISTPAGPAEATIAIPGLHSVRNALAAAACAYATGVPPAAIAAGLCAFRPYNRRLQVKAGPGGSTLIDDSYNANPDSVRAAIDVLAAAPGRSVLVFGDMGELGEGGPEFHAEIGRYARARGIGSLLALGESSVHTVAAFGDGARHFASLEDLLGHLRTRLDAQTTVLVKGSRFMQMIRVVEALARAPEETH